MSNQFVFISHKRQNEEARDAARIIQSRLKGLGFESFIDVVHIKRAADWKNAIFEHVWKADVLIVLLQKDTAKSDWIQREVDMARGAHISILPLIIDKESLSNAELKDAEKRLAIDNLQRWDFSLADDKIEANFAELQGELDQLSKQTRKLQGEWIAAQEPRLRLNRAATSLSAAAYQVPHSPCQIHLSTGDITRMRIPDGWTNEIAAVDVIINSENNYLQMARIFEATLSSALRREGAHLHNGRVLEDTVQRELEFRCAQNPHWNPPVAPRQVIATHAGHPKSNLHKHTHARFIFHAVTVEVDPAKPGEISPVIDAKSPESIHDVVTKCLELTTEINENKGLSPALKSDPEYAHPEGGFKDIESIIFPIFGTGHARLEVPDVVPHMLDAFKNFLDEHRHDPNMKLKRIHLSVFSDANLEMVNPKWIRNSIE